MSETCDQPYARYGDVTTCRLNLNHDDDCATANKMTQAAQPHTAEAGNGFSNSSP